MNAESVTLACLIALLTWWQIVSAGVFTSPEFTEQRDRECAFLASYTRPVDMHPRGVCADAHTATLQARLWSDAAALASILREAKETRDSIPADRLFASDLDVRTPTTTAGQGNEP